MNLEALRAQWTEYDRKLDALVRLNREAVREARISPVRRRLAWSGIFAGAEIAVTATFEVFLAAFVARHWGQPVLAMAAVALLAAAIPFLALQVRHLVLLSRIEYGAPVLELQKRVEALRMVQSAAGLWALGTGVILWPFAAMVLVEGIWGIDFSGIDIGVATVNLAFGCVAAFFVWRLRKHPGLRDELAGRTLASARARLAELARFESET